MAMPTHAADCLWLQRSARELIIPLAGARLGLTVSEVAIATAVGYVVDSIVFPFSAIVMDSRGRRSAFEFAFPRVLNKKMWNLPLMLTSCLQLRCKSLFKCCLNAV